VQGDIVEESEKAAVLKLHFAASAFGVAAEPQRKRAKWHSEPSHWKA
jgi:hypothetical protein